MLSEFPQKFGAYVLLGPLGEGGMGAVYLAMSGRRGMETLCVIKRLLPALLCQPEHVRRFHHEADLARRLQHSNLVHTHSVGEVEGEVFLVQEHVEGHDVSALLDELARKERRLPVPVAVHIAGEVARGLVYAHGFENLALVHRDINPPNIRLTYSGEVKLLDFGIASSNLHGDALGEHRGAGKLWHLAPEQVQPGGVVDRRTDIYALGLVLWELLTQRPVGTVRDGDGDGRKAETEGEVLVWITRGEHQSPSTFNPAVPPELDALVAKATHTNPEQRHGSAEAFRRELAEFIPPAFHPEPILASLLNELFLPEAERAIRRRLIVDARHLLQDSGAHQPPRRRVADQPRSDQTPQKAAVNRATRRWLRWMVPAGFALLGGTVALFWPHAPAENRLREPRADAARSGPTAFGSASPPMAPSPTPPPAPPPPPGHRGAEAARLPAEGKPALGAADPAAPAKGDHLRLAREAFNARDWPRALVEGKNAVASGGGAEAHTLLGNTYFKMGRFVEAEQSYAKAAALEPKNALLEERLRLARVRAREQAAKEN